MLETENLKKSFGRVKAVQDVSLKLNKGEILGLAGPNGAGKSTIFNCITNIPYEQDDGRVILDGEDISRDPPNEIFKKGLSRTFQQIRTFETLTVEQHFSFPYSNLNEPNPENKINELLEYLNLKEKKDMLPGKVTFLDKKKIMLGTALTNNPKVLLLDEPISGLSQSEIDEFKNIILNLQEERKMSLIIVEHHIEELVDLSDRLIILHEGKVFQEGKPEKVTKDEEVRKIYIGT